MSVAEFIKEFYIKTIDDYWDLISCYDADDNTPVVVVPDHYQYFDFVDETLDLWRCEYWSGSKLDCLIDYDINVIKFDNEHYSFAISAMITPAEDKIPHYPELITFNYLVKEIKL